MENLDAIFQSSYDAIASQRDDDAEWAPSPVTGWIWNRRKDDVMFVENAKQYPNGAIEIRPNHHYFNHDGEMDYFEGEYLVREVFPTRETATQALITKLDRRISRAQSMKKRLAKKLAALEGGSQ